MNTRTLVTAAIRLYGLFLIPGVIVGVIQGFDFVVFWGGQPEFPRWVSAGAATLGAVVRLALLVFLLIRTEVVTSWVLRGTAAEETVSSVSGSELMSIALSIAGVVFVVSGLNDLGGYAAAWYFLPQDRLTGNRPYIHSDWSRMIASALEMACGIVLLLGVKNIPRYLRWLRTA